MIAGFVGALPVTAVIVRSSANASAGARTKQSAIFHGFWLLLFIVFIPHTLNLIPLSSLASILILVGYKLTKIEMIKNMYKKGWNQFTPFFVTILSILFTDLLIGISIGMIVGFYFVIKSNMHKSIVMVHSDNHYLIKFYKDVSFLQKSTLLDILSKIPSGADVVIDGSVSVYVDDDIIDIVEDFFKRSKSLEISVHLKKSTLALSPYFRLS